MTASRVVEPLEAPPDAVVAVPGSKSITNRALVAAALARGVSQLNGALLADDTRAMLAGLRGLGVELEVGGDGASERVLVTGVGGAPPPSDVDVDARLSGTTARFLAPVLALAPGTHVLDAAAPMRSRPMGPALDALRALGAEVRELGEPGHLPVEVRSPGIRGGTVSVPGDVSSQFLSGLLLAGGAMPAGLTVSLTSSLVSQSYVALTLATMRAFGLEVDRPSPRDYVVPPGGYRAGRLQIEPDASAAAYFLAAAAITGGRVLVPGLTEHAWQGDVRFAQVLASMGASVRSADGIEVRGGALHGIDVDMGDISDTAQTLAAVAVFADGPTRVTGIGFIRAKETDRIAAVVTELRRCGIEAHEEADGFVVVPGRPRPATVRTYDDHRMAMSFALLGLRVPGIAIADPGCVAKTFPDFFDRLELLRGT